MRTSSLRSEKFIKEFIKSKLESSFYDGKHSLTEKKLKFIEIHENIVVAIKRVSII